MFSHSLFLDELAFTGTNWWWVGFQSLHTLRRLRTTLATDPTTSYASIFPEGPPVDLQAETKFRLWNGDSSDSRWLHPEFNMELLSSPWSGTYFIPRVSIESLLLIVRRKRQETCL